MNWKMVRNCFLVSVAFGVVVLLCLPSPRPTAGFHEKLKPENAQSATQASPPDATEQTVRQFGQGNVAGNASRPAFGSGSSGGGDRNAPMILTRDGTDSKTQLPAGSRIAVRLTQTAIVEATAMPVIGVVTQDFVQEDMVAIPAGSKLFGQVSFSGDADRAQIDWRAVELPDGRERELSATSVGRDGQVGVDGAIHSNGLQNTLGATLTRFIGAYAQGSMQAGILGAGPGGSDNGWKNAIAQTANDQANALAEDLKKQKRWIELNPENQFFAVLTSNFVFRDPGALSGR